MLPGRKYVNPSSTMDKLLAVEIIQEYVVCVKPPGGVVELSGVLFSCDARVWVHYTTYRGYRGKIYSCTTY